MRKNIFEILESQDFDLREEIYRIHELYMEPLIFFDNRMNRPGSYNKTIATVVDDLQFLKWSQRRSHTSLASFAKALSIDRIQHILVVRRGLGLSTEDYMIYLEFILNMIMLSSEIKSFSSSFDGGVYSVVFNKTKLNTLNENITWVLDNLGLEKHESIEEEKVIIVQANASATAVAEIIDDSLAFTVIEYNHHALKGNINRKREILKKFADDLEHKRKNLKNYNGGVEDLLFYMFNKLNIRHNNNNIELIANLGDTELESYYDEVYQLVLYSYLILDNSTRIKDLKGLKSRIEASKKSLEGEG